jgi:hypothetical protein
VTPSSPSRIVQVLETLLRKKGEPGEARARGGRSVGLSTPRSSTTDTQEALKQISSLLRTANTHLQILSPQQSDCASRGDLGSPRGPGEHLALSVTVAGRGLSADGAAPSLAWQIQAPTAGEGLSDPVEPASPRVPLGLGMPEELSGDSLTQDRVQQGLAGALSLDDVLQAILEGSVKEDSQVSAADVAANQGPGGPARGELAVGGSALASSGSLAAPLEGSLHSSEAAGSFHRGQLASASTSQGSSTIPALSSAEPTHHQSARLPSASPSFIPAHHPMSQRAGQEAPAPTPRSVGSSSPRMKALAAKISSGFKRMGCSEPKTRSGSNTPAGPSRRSAAGGPDPPGSARGKPAGLHGTPLKPRKIWI